MKSIMKNLSLLTMGLLIYSCNEKISPELQTGNSTTIPTATVPEEYYFKVTSKSPTILNYLLHRTGDGNHSKECKVSSSGTPFSSDLYIGDSSTAHDQKSYDISCYFETEELSLFFNGLSFSVDASKNTCEYIGYAPYSYYDAIPGKTEASFVGITCDQGLTDAHAAALAPGKGATYNGGTPVRCGYMVDVSIADDTLRKEIPIPQERQEMCVFDYETLGGGNGQNCDTGRPYFTIYNVFNSSADPLVITPAITLTESTRHTCGGSIISCVEGAIKQVSSLSGAARGTEIMASQLNTDFTKTYELPSLMGIRGGNFDIVNFRKGLAAKDINYLDYSTVNEPQWSGSGIEAFDPNIMEKFAANQYADNSTIIDTTVDFTNPTMTTYETVVVADGIRKTMYAADPFLGLNGSRVNPFYTFYCLDRAYEIKARIRMVVRDWDRVFSPGASYLELISDSGQPLASRRQDLPSDEEEVGGDPGNYNYFNDKDDWDNLVELSRTDTLFDSYDTYVSNNGLGSVVIEPSNGWWEVYLLPIPPLQPSARWWDSSIFPKQGPRE